MKRQIGTLIALTMMTSSVWADAAANLTSPTAPTPPAANATAPANNLDTALNSQFTQDTALTGANIKAHVDNGVAILEGTVTSKDQEQKAILLAKATPGIQDVKSNLTIK